MEGSRKRGHDHIEEETRKLKAGKFEEEDGETTDMVIVPVHRISITIGEQTFFVDDEKAKRALARIASQFGTTLNWRVFPNDIQHLILAYLRDENHQKGGVSYFTLPLVCKSWLRHFNLLLREMPGPLYSGFLREYQFHTIRTLFALQMHWLETGLVSGITVHFRLPAELDLPVNKPPSRDPVFIAIERTGENTYNVRFSSEARNLKHFGFCFSNSLKDGQEFTTDGGNLYGLFFACTPRIQERAISRLGVSISKDAKFASDQPNTLLQLVKATRVHCINEELASDIVGKPVDISVEKYHTILKDTKNPAFRDQLYAELSRSPRRGAKSLWGKLAQ